MFFELEEYFEKIGNKRTYTKEQKNKIKRAKQKVRQFALRDHVMLMGNL